MLYLNEKNSDPQKFCPKSVTMFSKMLSQKCYYVLQNVVIKVLLYSSKMNIKNHKLRHAVNILI